MKPDLRSPEEKTRAKRVHALVMMVMGAIMSACALAGGLILLSGAGDLPGWMYGRWGKPRQAPAIEHVLRRPTVHFEEFNSRLFIRAQAENKLVLLYLSSSWSSDNRVMEAVFADARVAAWLARNALMARADADLRPDLARRYLGGGASLGTIIFLSDGRPIAEGGSASPEWFLAWADLILRGARDPAKAEALASAFVRMHPL